MADNESVIDLTECSFTLANHHRLDNVIINLDTEDSFREENNSTVDQRISVDRGVIVNLNTDDSYREENVRTVGRANKRRKRRYSRTRASNHPDTSILDLCTPDAKNKKSTKAKNESGKVHIPDETPVKKPKPSPAACPICFEEFCGQPLASTKCGHVFCLECIKVALKSKSQCPTCRTSLRGSTKYHPLFL